MARMRSTEAVTKLIMAAPAVQKALKLDQGREGAEAEFRTAIQEAVAGAAFLSDRLVYRLAIGVLSLLALTAAGCAVKFGLDGNAVPEVLVSLGSASVGALVGLFANPPSSA